MKKNDHKTFGLYYTSIDQNEKITTHHIPYDDQSNSIPGYIYTVMFYDENGDKNTFPVGAIFKSTHDNANADFFKSVTEFMQNYPDVIKLMPQNTSARFTKTENLITGEVNAKECEQIIIDAILRLTQ